MLPIDTSVIARVNQKGTRVVKSTTYVPAYVSLNSSSYLINALVIKIIAPLKTKSWERHVI